MLRIWLNGIDPDEPLFPKLAKRKTWLMVKKDLTRVGIPYENKEGIADFHAAGRHTHITELLRKGASLAEVKELARHTDVRMTMKYTHIGLEDQARAVAKISWERLGSASDVSNGHFESPGVTADEIAGSKKKPKTPVNDGSSQERAPPVSGGPKRRTRGSNPQPLRAIDFESTC